MAGPWTTPIDPLYGQPQNRVKRINKDFSYLVVQWIAHVFDFSSVTLGKCNRLEFLNPSPPPKKCLKAVFSVRGC